MTRSLISPTQKEDSKGTLLVSQIDLPNFQFPHRHLAKEKQKVPVFQERMMESNIIFCNPQTDPGSQLSHPLLTWNTNPSKLLHNTEQREQFTDLDVHDCQAKLTLSPLGHFPQHWLPRHSEGCCGFLCQIWIWIWILDSFSLAMLETVTKATWGRRVFIWLTLISVIIHHWGNQCRNSSKTQSRDHRAILLWLALRLSHSQLAFLKSSHPLAYRWCCPQWIGPSHINHQSRLKHKTNGLGPFWSWQFNWGSIFPSDSRLCHVGNKSYPAQERSLPRDHKAVSMIRQNSRRHSIHVPTWFPSLTTLTSTQRAPFFPRRQEVLPTLWDSSSVKAWTDYIIHIL